MKYAWNFLLHHVDRDPAGRMYSKLIFTLNDTKEGGLVWISSNVLACYYPKHWASPAFTDAGLLGSGVVQDPRGDPRLSGEKILEVHFLLKVSYLSYQASLEEADHGLEIRSGEKGEIEWK